MTTGKHRRLEIKRRIRETSIPLLLMTMVNVSIGAGLMLQPVRWVRTPAYGILLEMFSQNTWGLVYLCVSLLMIAALIFDSRSRSVTVIAHLAALALASIWLVAFIARYLSDPSTTVVNMLSWSLHISVLSYSLSIIDRATLSKRILSSIYK